MSTVSENHIIIYLYAIPCFNCYLDYPDSLSLSLSRISFLTTVAMMFLMFTAYTIIGQNDSDDEIVKIMNVSPDGAVVVVVVVVDG